MTIGEIMLKARKTKGLNQRMAAELSGLTRECLCRLELGGSPEPKFKTIQALCKLYAISMDDLEWMTK